ncbi:hypothetical protein BST45_07210 [Mycobacterium shinjukuense]|nr:hypothetical protein BST45_07210 [Mycobacterium shinjukuense]
MRPGTQSRLLRRWRIPRVIRHVAKWLFLCVGGSRLACALLGHALGAWGRLSTVTAHLRCARGLRIH